MHRFAEGAGELRSMYLKLNSPTYSTGAEDRPQAVTAAHTHISSHNKPQDPPAGTRSPQCIEVSSMFPGPGEYES